MTDTIFDLADSLGFQDLGRSGPQGDRPVASAMAAADSEGRTGGDFSAPGAVPSMPKPLGPPRFGDGPPTPGQPGPPPPTPPWSTLRVGAQYDALPDPGQVLAERLGIPLANGRRLAERLGLVKP